MSRAINLNASESDVRAACTSANIGISVIEPLPTGGTRVVCITGEGASTLRRSMKKKVIEGRVERSGFFLAQRAR